MIMENASTIVNGTANDGSYDAMATVNMTLGNATSEPYVDFFPSPRFVGRFLQTATMTFIFVAGLIGNLLVILLCLKKPKELKVSRRFILHLAILNFSMCVLLLPSVIVSAAAQDWVLSNAWCVAMGFFKTLLLVCIILNLVLISLDRYFSVVKPLHYYTSITVKHHGVFLGIVWLLGFLFALPPLIGWSKIVYHPSRYICTSDWTQTNYTIFTFVLGFVVPFVVMLFVYLTIYSAARRLMKRKQGRRLSADIMDSASGSGGGSIRASSSLQQGSSSEHSSGSHKSSSRASGIFRRRGSRLSKKINVTEEWKVAKTGVIVMASFVICWLPYYIVLMVDDAYGFGTTVPLSMPYAWFECFATWMALSSCAINPYVYVLRSPPMRKQASKAARTAWERMRQCCEEDSRIIRRRESKSGRYSFRALSNRFSSHRRPGKGVDSLPKDNREKQQQQHQQQEEAEQDKMIAAIPSDPEAQQVMTPEAEPLVEHADEATDKHADEPEGNDGDPEARIELLSHKTLEV